MPFPTQVRDDALVACARHCCLCHRFCGIKIELHHVVQRAEGGEDSFDNCIPLCFDCHADMRSYDHKHPKGTKYTPGELKRHRDAWYAKVQGSIGSRYDDGSRELDRKVFVSLKIELPYDGVIQFLEAHDFGAPFLLKKTNPLDEFVYKSGDPSKEFIDPDLEGMRAKLVDDTIEFMDYMATHTWPTTSGLQSVPREWEDSQHKRLVEVVDKLNKLSSAVVKSYGALIREGRRRLGVE